MLQVAWLGFGLVILAASLFARRSTHALLIGRIALAALFLLAGACVNAVFLLQGADYSGFADSSYVRFVRETWRAVVAPNQLVFIPLLILFEASVGVLLLLGGRWARLGLVSAMGFHVALLAFGWWYYVWAIPMLVAMALLFRAQRRPHRAARRSTRLLPPLRPDGAAQSWGFRK
jgi:hypothetical protein